MRKSECDYFLVIQKEGKELVLDVIPSYYAPTSPIAIGYPEIDFRAKVLETREYVEDRAYLEVKAENARLKSHIQDLQSQITAMKKILVNHRDEALKAVAEAVKKSIPF
jgi:hypothetical protein